MKSEFSEFSYGFAVTNELINWYGTDLTAAPYFPSLIDEGSIGYDLRLNRPAVPLFIQFKLSERISVLHKTVRERKEGLFNSPFFRMHLRNRYLSKQHDLLCELQDNGNEVYYVTPFFIDERWFNELYLKRRVCQESFFISPLNIGKFNDYDKHHISFQKSGKAYKYSEPTRIKDFVQFENLTKQISDKLNEQKRTGKFGKTYWLELSENIEELLQKPKNWFSSSVSVERLRKIQNPLEKIGFISQTVLRSHLFIANYKRDLENEIETTTRQQNPFNSTIG